jgi:hypothetical protein
VTVKRDDSPNPFVVEARVRRLSWRLQSCFAPAAGLVRIPPDPAAQLQVAAHGAILRAEVLGVADLGRRRCVERILRGVRVPPFAHPPVRTYVISLSWLRLEALVPDGQ